MKNQLRYLFAHAMYRLQLLRFRAGWQRIWTRHKSWDPCRCEECGWKGPLRWSYHGYEDDGTGEDVVACDECPQCGCPVTTEV